ncbi:TolC family protein [Methylomonas koyamae]|uniref:TolC family protein n=1 Tax=Methylomonas koyamae TaxID=702114 RepID=UPI002110D3FC|nr:TolC family protein [Methylomonas koyamae]
MRGTAQHRYRELVQKCCVFLWHRRQPDAATAEFWPYSGRYRYGRSQAKRSLSGYQKAVLDALQETETALTHYLKEEIRRQQLARAVDDLKESVRLSQLRYHEGVISFLDVLDAQRAQYVAEIELARSAAATSTNLIAVYKALGGGADATIAP